MPQHRPSEANVTSRQINAIVAASNEQPSHTISLSHILTHTQTALLPVVLWIVHSNLPSDLICDLHHLNHLLFADVRIASVAIDSRCMHGHHLVDKSHAASKVEATVCIAVCNVVWLGWVGELHDLRLALCITGHVVVAHHCTAQSREQGSGGEVHQEVIHNDEE